MADFNKKDINKKTGIPSVSLLLGIKHPVYAKLLLSNDKTEKIKIPPPD